MVSLYSILFEDTFSDLVKKFPNLEEKLIKAKEIFDLKLQGQNKQKYLPWIVKVIQTTEEPVEDIVPLVLTFDKKQPALKAKGQPSDINSYKTVQELAKAIQSLEKAKEELSVESIPNLDVLYNKPNDPWVLVMARDTESSCESGSGTTWCTARTQGQNLFMSYVAREGSPVVLFYIINKELDSRKVADAKLSVGFVDKKPVFDGKDGSLSVNAENKGITEDRFQQILGKERAGLFLSLMQTKANSIEKHPAREELENLLNDPVAFEKKLESFKDEDMKEDFIDLVFDSEISEEKANPLLNIVLQNKRIGTDVIDQYHFFSQRGYMPLFIQRKLLKYKDESTKLGIKRLLSMDYALFPEIIDSLIDKIQTPKEINQLIESHKSKTTPEQIRKIYLKFHDYLDVVNHLVWFNFLPDDLAFDVLENIELWSNYPRAQDNLIRLIFSKHEITSSLFKKFQDSFGAKVGLLLNNKITINKGLQYAIVEDLVEIYNRPETAPIDLQNINEALKSIKNNKNLNKELFDLLLSQIISHPEISGKFIPILFFENKHFTEDNIKALYKVKNSFNRATQQEILGKYAEFFNDIISLYGDEETNLFEVLFRKN